MADPRLPGEMDDYMREADWPEHHEQWHYEQRHDFYHHLANRGDPRGRRAVAYMAARNWGRAPHQEGAPGHGLHFLAMHRAMFQLLSERFPQHAAYLEGWRSIPQDPDHADDPVPDATRPEARPFDSEKRAAIARIEGEPASFASEDEFALFLETSMRPTAADPAAQSGDRRTGLHNYLHGRWSDGASPVNLGLATVNLFNARFWRMHGWIERVWTDFRSARGLSDDDPAYVALIRDYRHMMEGHGGHHLMAARRGPGLAAEASAEGVEAAETAAPLDDFFADGA